MTHNKRIIGLVQSPLFISLLVAIITLITFVLVLDAEFVRWDDDISIYENETLRNLSLEGIKRILTDVDSMMRYNPLTLLSWSITYHFWGLNPFWYHLGNWLLHGLNAGLVFFVLRKLILLGHRKHNKEIIAFWINCSAAIAALVWSLHPLRVEPVAWANDRTYCQALFFLLLSTLCYLRANEPDVNTSKHHFIITASVICYALSLLSYAIGMTFFVVLIVLDVYPLGRLGGNKGWLKTTATRRVLLEKLPYIAMAFLIAAVTISVRIASAGYWQKPIPLSQFGLIERLMQAIYIWAYYVWRPWYPINLAPVYATFISFEPFSLPFLFSGFGIVGVTVTALLMRRRWPLGLALVICHLALLVPVLGVLEYPHFHVDRYSLIVSISWSILLAALLTNRKIRISFRYAILSLSIVIVIILGLMSFRQTRVWNNSVTLFKHMLKTLDNDPYSFDIHYRLGTALFHQGETSQAIEHFKKALEINPFFIEAHNFLGIALVKQGKYDDAIKHFKYTLNLEPNSPMIHYKLATIYHKQGKLELVVKHCTEALRIKPDFLEVRLNLARTLFRMGKTDSSLEQYYKILKFEPNHIEILNELSWLLAITKDVNIQNPTDAIKFARKACELTEYNYPVLLDTLAIAYASAGRFEEAIETAGKAIKLAEAENRKSLAIEIQKRLKLYQSGKPYHKN